MSKHLIHFQDQLKATSNPDPILMYYERDYSGSDRGRLHALQTRKGQLTSDLVGMRFQSMKGNCPIFVSELVDA